uniref:Uncharacterized protein n=1 Tax=viral metagenome TaxID=1070528 RepID=A0A6C0KQG9_9ZZZZ
MEKDTFILSAKQIFSASKDDLNHILFQVSLKMFREQILNHLISRRNEDDYFNLDPFSRNTHFRDILETVRQDLNSSGWKTELSFNDTGLFIFKNEKPKTCW